MAVGGSAQADVNFAFGDSTSFPIATAAPGATGSAAFDGTNFLVDIQTQTTVGAQLVSPAGVTLGPLITTNRSGNGVVLAFNGTNYLLAWADDTTGAGVPMYGQLVSPSGAAIGAPFRISQSTAVRDKGDAGASDGTNYFLVWTDTRLSSSNSSLYYIYGQVVAPDGTPLGSEIPISETAGKDANVWFGGGAYLVVWTETSTGATVMGRPISPTGAPVGSEFVINASPAESDDPKVVAFGRTNFLVLWPDEVDPGSGQWNIFGQLVTPSGALTEEVLQITSGPGEQFFPTLAFDGRNYLVTWTNFTCSVFAGETCGSVYGEYLSQCGTPMGAAFPIGAGPGTQMISPVAFGAGQYLVAWNSDATLSHSGLSGGDVYGTFLAPAPQVCVGDCNGDGQVTVDEILTMVNIALGNAEVSACEAGDVNGDGQITIDEILRAVNNALNGCE